MKKREKPIILLKAPRFVCLALRNNYDWHGGYWVDSITKIDNGLRKLMEENNKIADLKEWIRIVDGEVKDSGYLAIWHPEINLELVQQATDREVIEISGQSVEECIEALAKKNINKELHFGMVADGVGDSLLGACCVNGCEEKYVYHTKHIEWAKLFIDNVTDMTGEFININKGYGEETVEKCKNTRIKRYLNNAGIKEAKLPELKNKEVLKSKGSEWKDVIVLCPNSAYQNRMYSKHGWDTIEKELQKRGYKTYYLPGKMKPEEVASIFLNCHSVVSCDSGMAHFSSMIGTKTIVLSGPTNAKDVFFNPVIEVKSKVHCQGCYWDKNYMDNHKVCDVSCAALWAINPFDVVDAIITTPESKIHPHHKKERAELFMAYDAGSVEVETGEMLQALVRTYKPELILETGTYLGVAARLLGEACKKNGFGKVITLEINTERISQYTKKNLEGLGNVELIEADALKWLREYEGEPFGLIFLDSEFYLRVKELKIIKERGLAKGPVFVHDTSRLRKETMDVRECPTYPEDLDELGLGGIECPNSRGWRLFNLGVKDE